MRKILTAVLLLAVPSCAMMAPKTTPAFLVFFDEHSASLDTAGAGVIAQAADAAKAAPGSPVVVLGYTDSAGLAAADVTLSQQRAQAVSDALVADGVEPGRITRHGRGQTHEEPGQASRRVEIDIGG